MACKWLWTLSQEVTLSVKTDAPSTCSHSPAPCLLLFHSRRCDSALKNSYREYSASWYFVHMLRLWRSFLLYLQTKRIAQAAQVTVASTATPAEAMELARYLPHCLITGGPLVMWKRNPVLKALALKAGSNRKDTRLRFLKAELVEQIFGTFKISARHLKL